MSLKMDYDYLCQNLGHLSGVPTRVYKGLELRYHYANASFDPDPVALVRNRIVSSRHALSYLDTPEFLMFGVIKVRKDGIVLVIGPTSQIKPSREQMSAVLRALGEPYGRMGELVPYFENVQNYPLENFLQILCFVNYALNGQRRTVDELLRQERRVAQPPAWRGAEPVPTQSDEVSLHNTYETERTMLCYIAAGNLKALDGLFSQPPTGRPGKMAYDELRQRKNTFVCAATIASRAAIQGGLSPEAAFSMSDLYIQKAELMRDPKEIALLTMAMLREYAKRVERIRCRGSGSPLVTAVLRHILQNIHRKLSVRGIASELGMNRSYLGERFRSDTGVPLGAFITEQKIEEAKRLLRTTDQTIAQISEYLCFSSQSYFQNVFRKAVGCTPRGYRDREEGGSGTPSSIPRVP